MPEGKLIDNAALVPVILTIESFTAVSSTDDRTTKPPVPFISGLYIAGGLFNRSMISKSLYSSPSTSFLISFKGFVKLLLGFFTPLVISMLYDPIMY